MLPKLLARLKRLRPKNKPRQSRASDVIRARIDAMLANRKSQRANCDKQYATSDERAGIKMVVGLGNPGDEYVDTRHNIGFKVIDSLADRLGAKVKKRKFGARFGQAEFADKKLRTRASTELSRMSFAGTLILLKPWQFMNRSGQAVATAMGFYKLAVSDLLVVTDDMALEPGRIRIRAKGSAGGHNGLADIIEKLGTNEFARCRIGIGHGDERVAYDYVLDKPTEAEKPLLDEAIVTARDAVLCWVEYGIEKTMNEFNKG
ncbi:MAG: aminoacyl-tRNA hydrolase [Phycisphaerae bacterium]